MATANLSTKKVIDDLEVKAEDYVVYDTALKGRCVHVFPSGTKIWKAEYRPGSGGRKVNKKRITLGSTSLLTPAQSARMVRDLFARARLGDDPAARRRAERETPTLNEVNAEYLADVAATKASSTATLYETYMRVHVAPWLGTRKITAISNSDLRKRHRAIGRTHTATANRVITTLSGVFAFAAKGGLVPEGFNPAKGIEKFKEVPKERFLRDEELARLGAVLRQAESEGLPWDSERRSKHGRKPDKRLTVFSPFVVAAVRLLLFTGARLREILHLQWEHVDLQRGLLFLPTSKTGKRTIVLSAPSMEILASLPRFGPYVVPGDDPMKPRADLHKPWTALTRAAELPGLRLHDLRHTHASIGAGGGLGLPVIGALLGHRNPATTAKYAHLDVSPLHRASNTIGASIAAAMGDTRRPKADVATLRR